MNGKQREGDLVLDDAIEKAIATTCVPLREATVDVCPGHPELHRVAEGTREGVHVLLLCRKADRQAGVHDVAPMTTIGFGPFKMKTNSTNADWIYRMAVTIVGMIVGVWLVVQMFKIKAEVVETRMQFHSGIHGGSSDVAKRAGGVVPCN